MALDPDVIKPTDYAGGCIPHGSRVTFTLVFGEGVDNELRRCPGCKKWWYKDPAYFYIWEPVHWHHFDMRKRISQHERKIASQMHTLVPARRHVED